MRTRLQTAPLRENRLRTLIMFKYPGGQSSIVRVSCASVTPSLTLKQTRKQVFKVKPKVWVGYVIFVSNPVL